MWYREAIEGVDVNMVILIYLFSPMTRDARILPVILVGPKRQPKVTERRVWEAALYSLLQKDKAQRGKGE